MPTRDTTETGVMVADKSETADQWLRSSLLWILAGLLVVGGAWTAFGARSQFLSALHEVRTIEQAIQQITMLESIAVEAQARHRDHLLSKNSADLAGYRQAMARLAQGMDSLRVLMREHPLNDTLIANLHKAWISTVQSPSGISDPDARVSTPLLNGDAGVKKVRAQLAQLKDVLRSEFQSGLGSLETLVKDSNIVIFQTLGLAIVSSLVGMYLLRRHLLTLEKLAGLRRKSEEKNTHLAHLSHEIRTPLHAIFGFVDLLRRSVSDQTHLRYIEAIQKSGRTLLTLVNDILDLAKIEAGKLEIRPTAINLRETVEDVIILFSSQAQHKNISLRAVYDPRLPAAVKLDAERLRQVLANLIGNALKYTDAGEVVLSLDLTGRGSGRATLSFHVRDTGIGISAQDLPHIFMPFKRGGSGNSARPGSGLGLSVAQQLTELMGGTLTVESEVGRGSLFSVHFPEVVVTEPRQVPAGSAQDNASPTLEVLVVDDVALNRQMLIDMLSDRHHVSGASDGEEALRHMSRNRPDLVLMDIRMPGLSGLEAVQRMHADPNLRDIPVIAATASPGAEAEGRALALFDGYLRKPFDKGTLLKEMARITVRRREMAKQKPMGGQEAPEDHRSLSPELDRLVSEGWPKVRTTGSMQAVRDFAQTLARLCAPLPHNSLRRYSELLCAHVASFDVAGIESLLEEFPRQVERFKEHPGGKRHAP